MRVLHLDSGREMRGGQWQVLRLMEGLAAAGVENTLLARLDGPLLTAARARGLSAEPLGVVRALGATRRHDLVHAHDAHTHSLGLLLAPRPLVVSRRVAFPVRSRWKYSRPRLYLAISGLIRQVLIDGGVPAEKIRVVYDGVPLLGPSQGSQVLGLEKDFSLLAGLGVKVAVRLEEEIAGAGIFVYLTASEGLGSGALLAMSAGVPVIASNVGGLREVIRHGENGLLVENQEATIRGAIQQLIDNPDEARRLGAEARRTVQERFTIGAMVNGTLASYGELLRQ